MSKLKIQFIDAGVGDCILITDLSTNQKVLVDSGPGKGSGRATVISTLKRLLSQDNKIDLAILTHNDDDHIGGFPGLINNGIVSINKILFNSVAELEEDELIPSSKSSYSQDLNLFKIIKETNIDIESLTVKPECENKIELGEIKLTFISPNEDKISALRCWAIKQKQKLDKKSSSSGEMRNKASKASSYISLDEALDSIEEEDVFVPDKREPNGSSFAFILEYGSRRMLFLGDCHMDIVEQYFESKDSKDKFDLVKLSHHSSECNNSQEFFNLIECDNFVVCSDGINNHGHPSMKTMARLTKALPDSKIYFTSSSRKIQDFTESFKDRCVFPIDRVLEFTYDLSE
tara:strand:- start:4134 stop:5171 length:1038 start_codon:yes stop_codon:yes gene_type:complete